MRYIINNSTDPYFNIALEEYCLMYVDPGEDYFLLWQNEPAIIIGKNQNTLEEINPAFVEERGIKVVRRISGGGAVYHDLGNLNFTFISKVDPVRTTDFSVFANPVIKVLRELGVHAMLLGRNDIIANDRKISGNAQRLYRTKFLQHGTLLFDVNIDDLAEALNVSSDKIQSKGIKSIRSRVGNIREFLKEDMTIEGFRELLQKSLSDDYRSDEIRLSEEDLQQIEERARSKFASWAWTYGGSPPFNYRSEKRFPGGKVGVFIHVKDGLMAECKFFGDFLSILDTEDFATGLIGLKYERETLEAALSKTDLSPYFGSITGPELMEVMMEQ
ncbi:lipoate--protein ligase [Bacillota bacterium]